MTTFNQGESDSFQPSPYFTLTKTWHDSVLRQNLGDPPLPPRRKAPKVKQQVFKLREIFGSFKDMSDDGQAQFLLTITQHADMDWLLASGEAAKARRITPISKVQGRIRGIARKHDFALDSDNKLEVDTIFKEALVGPATAESAQGSSSNKSTKSASKKSGTPKETSKKRKNDSPCTKGLATKASKTRADKDDVNEEAAAETGEETVEPMEHDKKSDKLV